MDLASIFYTLGIIFFVSVFLLIVGLVIFVWRLYIGVTNLKNEMPGKVVGFLQSQNTTGLKALAVAAVGFLISGLRDKLSGRNK